MPRMSILTHNVLELQNLLHKVTKEENNKVDMSRYSRGESKVNRFLRKREEEKAEDSFEKIEREIISNDVNQLMMKIKEKKNAQIKVRNNSDYMKPITTQQATDANMKTEKRRKEHNSIKKKIDELITGFESAKHLTKIHTSNDYKPRSVKSKISARSFNQTDNQLHRRSQNLMRTTPGVNSDCVSQG